MHCKKHIPNILLLFFLLPFFAAAQPGYTLRKIKYCVGTALVFNYARIKDEYFSKAYFNGVLPGVNINAKIKNNKTDHLFEFEFGKGVLSNHANKLYKADALLYNAGYTGLYTINNQQGASLLNIKAGVDVRFFYFERAYTKFINNNTAYDISLSVAPVFEIGYSFKKAKGLHISNRLAIPLIAFAGQPSFGAESADGSFQSNNKFLFKNASFVNVNKFRGVQNKLMVYKPLGLQHGIGLQYVWDVRKLNISRSTFGASHKFYFQYYFNF
jgi:hypothetical protein